MSWTANDIPDLTNRTIIVTGANTGLGYASVVHFAQHGASEVVLACRSKEKGEAAIKSIIDKVPAAKDKLVFEELDLTDFDSIRSFAARFTSSHDKLHILMNNAGIMACPQMETKQGIEMQFGTNHVGHFLLTKLLWPCLNTTDGSRVVIVSSLAHKSGVMNFDDMHYKRTGYGAFKAYGRSKLANLLMMMELNRRIQESDSKVKVFAAHPGGSKTELGRQYGTKLLAAANAVFFFLSSAEYGSLSQVRAAADPNAKSGDYYGPKGWMGEIKGPPSLVEMSESVRNGDDAKTLWKLSEELIGEDFTV